jgi:hypothetical protein
VYHAITRAKETGARFLSSPSGSHTSQKASLFFTQAFLNEMQKPVQ